VAIQGDRQAARQNARCAACSTHACMLPASPVSQVFANPISCSRRGIGSMMSARCGVASAGFVRVREEQVGVVIRQFILLVVVIVLASNTGSAGAQSPAATASSQTALAEAKRLATQVDELSKQGKFAEALPLAEQCLSLREHEL